MKQPVIYFKNYMLRDIEVSDAKDMFEYGSDMDVVKFLSWGPYVDESEAVASIKKFFLSRPDRGLPVGYAIIDLEKNKMIGTIDIHTKVSDGVYEIGYALNKHYWGKGIMTEALRKLLEVSFWYHSFDKIVIGHAVDNVASEQVIKKNGFIFEKTDYERAYNRFTGQTDPSKWYYLTKENFK
ncbi:GNAT family N-acetyltransferase [Acholeplasma hippikon]|nr:GNAT family N-acetyltransferase [Acholeplasma hippikon]